MAGYSLEINRRVYDDEEGTSIEVRPDPDFPEDNVLIHTGHDAKSKDYYGDIRLSLSKEMARLLGQALLEQSYK